MLIVNNTAASASVISNFRFRASGTDNSTALYGTAGLGIDANGIARDIAQDGVAQGVWAYNQSNLGNQDATRMTATIYDPQTAFESFLTFTAKSRFTNGAPMVLAGAIFSGQTNVFDGFTLFPASGTIGGTLRVYGLRNS
jgi:hypothetical protein